MTELKPGTPELPFRCSDIDLDCSFEATEMTEPLLLRKYTEHAEYSHNLPFLPPDVLMKIKKATKK